MKVLKMIVLEPSDDQHDAIESRFINIAFSNLSAVLPDWLEDLELPLPVIPVDTPIDLSYINRVKNAIEAGIRQIKNKPTNAIWDEHLGNMVQCREFLSGWVVELMQRHAKVL